MELKGSRCRLRPWKEGDAESLASHANNRKIWLNLRDGFPHPYTLKDAQSWIESCHQSGNPLVPFTIIVDGAAVGGIGFGPTDQIHYVVSEIGYWLGESYWGEGITTEAVQLVSDYAFKNFGVIRLQACVYEWNPASKRVLEKAGFHQEARLEKSICKDGKVIDQYIYAKLN